MGSIRKEPKDRSINFTTENDCGGNMEDGNNDRRKSGKMGEFASSTITDLRQVMMSCELDNLANGPERNVPAMKMPGMRGSQQFI